MGLKLMMWLPESWNIQPGVYAVVAATAVLAGVFRSSISLVSTEVLGQVVGWRLQIIDIPGKHWGSGPGIWLALGDIVLLAG